MLNFHLFLAITFSFLYIYIAFRAPPFVSLADSHVLCFLSASTTSKSHHFFLSSIMPLPFYFFHQLLSFPPGSFSFCFASFLSAYLYFPFLCLPPPSPYNIPTIESNMEILQV